MFDNVFKNYSCDIYFIIYLSKFCVSIVVFMDFLIFYWKW